MKITNAWTRAMWAELERLPPEQRIVACGEWISMMTRVLLPKLGLRRRTEILDMLAQPDWDARRLAETIGTRTTTINRLADEGRAALRTGATKVEEDVNDWSGDDHI